MQHDDALVLGQDREDGLTTLTLNRPNAFNSLSKDLLTALQAELDRIAASETVRVVVIAGAGKDPQQRQKVDGALGVARHGEGAGQHALQE